MRVCLLLALALVMGCTTSQPHHTISAMKSWSDEAQDRRTLMVGKWLGEARTDDDKLRLTLVERSANGTYRITFRTYDGNDYEESVEVGLWGLSGPVYFTIMRGWMTGGGFAPADTTQAYFYDAYEVISLDQVSFDYRSLETGNRFGVQRVGNDFQFAD